MAEPLLPEIIERPSQACWRAGRNYHNRSARGLWQFDTPDSITTLRVLEQVQCISIQNPFGAPLAYFHTAFGPDITETTVTIKVRVFSETPQRLWIEYDSTDASVLVVNGKPGAFKRSTTVDIQPAVWQEHSFVLPDMIGTSRINGGDFQVVCTQQEYRPFFIQSVHIGLNGRTATACDAEEPIDRFEKALRVLAFDDGTNPEVSIVIPFVDCREFTQQCLVHLHHSTQEHYEIILVDDGSSQGVKEQFELIAGITLVSNGKNLGYANSCNRGAEIANGSHLVFLNNDTVPTRFWLRELMACIAQNPNAGVVGSKLVYPGTELIQHSGVFFDSFGWPHHGNRYCQRDSGLVNLERVVPAVTGACLLTPRSVFERLDGFDENYRNGYEDIDYCLRVQDSGMDVVYCPTSELFHYESITDGRIDGVQEAGNQTTFKNKWGKKLSLYSNNQEREKKLSLAVNVAANLGYPLALQLLEPVYKSIKDDAGANYISASEKILWNLVQAFLYFQIGDTTEALTSLREVPEELTDHDVGELFSRFFLEGCGGDNTRLFDRVKLNSAPNTEQPRVAVYTALFGDYDDLTPLISYSSRVEFICFTDRPISPSGWEIKIVDRTTDNDNLEAKRFKIFPWEYLEGYDYSLFVDANTLFFGNVDLLIRTVLLGNDFAAWAHPERSNFVAECFKIFITNKHPRKPTIDLLKYYIDSASPTDVGMIEASFLWRSHHSSKVRALMKIWWEHINAYSLRDQVSLAYLMHNEKIRPKIIPDSFGTSRENVWFLKTAHRSTQGFIGNKPRARAARKNCIFVYSEKYRRSGSTVLRCFQAVELINKLKPGLNAAAVNTLDIDNSLVILTKGSLKEITVEEIQQIKLRHNTILADFIDDPVRRELLPLLDGLIASSISGYLYFTKTFPDVRTFHLTHTVDSRLPCPVDTNELKIGYFGELANTIINNKLSAEVDYIGIDTSKAGFGWARHIIDYNCHYIVRKRKQIDGFKPFSKGFIAAHFNAPIIVEDENREVDYYLGPDYPFTVTSNDEDSVLACIDYVKACYRTKFWREMVERMYLVKERSSHHYFVDEFERIIQAL